MPGLTPNDRFPQENTETVLNPEESEQKAVKFEIPSVSIEQQYHDLQLAHRNLQLEHNSLEQTHNKLKSEFRRLQESEFKARKKDQAEPHESVSQQFLDVFRISTDWARDYFKIDIRSLCVDDHELFKRHLGAVSWEGDLTRKRELNVSHLVQAVVADVLARRILLSPFAGCPSSFTHEVAQLYEAMLKENNSQAQKWRATTLATYGRCTEWTPFNSPISPESISRCREMYYDAVAKEIDLIIDPIARKHFPDRNDHDVRFQASMEFIEAAGDLAVMLGRKAAELRIMDKSWFNDSGRVFVCDDQRMKGRLAEEDEDDLNEALRVDIVLRPGFLKYGNDDGENLEKYAVWVPAMLDLGKVTDSGVEGEWETQPPPRPQSPYTPEEEIVEVPTEPELPDAFTEKQGTRGFLSNLRVKMKGMIKVYKKKYLQSGPYRLCSGESGEWDD